MSNSIITQVADTLCRRLLSAGFIVHRYDAYSTNSIYLKLDCGVCNSIRISDHTGKSYLKSTKKPLPARLKREQSRLRSERKERDW